MSQHEPLDANFALPHRPQPGVGVCTIISKNYLASARALFRSVRCHHPDVPFYVLLVDCPDGCFDPNAEPFEVILVQDLPNVPDATSLFFKYGLLELNTAVKPFFMAHLLETRKLRKLVYFDPDIYLFAPLDPVLRPLDEYAVVLTPHITQPIEDDREPGEVNFLRAGTFNLGFVAVAAGDSTDAFLHWWQKRLYDFCLTDQTRGYFTDQKWVNLAPALFDGFYTLKDPGCNIAYWNLHYRAPNIALRADRAFLGDAPVCFFHFSGFRPEQPDVVSKYQDRIQFADHPNLRAVFDFYADELRRCGIGDAEKWPYAYGRFDNGVAIPALARTLYLSLDPARRRGFGDPFQAEGDGSFFAWLTRSGPISPLWIALHESAPDLRAVFPDPENRDREAFSQWVRTDGVRRCPADAVFLPPPAALLSVAGLRQEAARFRAKLRGRLHHSGSREHTSS